MTRRASDRARRRLAGHQTALALLQLGSSSEVAADQVQMIRSAAEDDIQLVGMVSGLLDFVDILGRRTMGEAAWRTWLAEHIADLAMQQTLEG